MNAKEVYYGFADVREQNAFVSATYRWMLVGLAVSAAVSFAVASVPALTKLIFGNPVGWIVVPIAEIAVVIWLSASIRTISVSAATLGFVVYSALNGATLASIFFIYELGSIVQVFAISAALFGVMSVYGAKTKKSLVTAGRYAMMALWGIIIASVVNLLLRSSSLNFAVSFVGVLIFTVLTAYDTQKILAIGANARDTDDWKKVAIIAALELYLDFINIFIRLLQLFGKRRD